MVIAVNFESNIKQIEKQLSDVARRQVPIAAMWAVNDTAFEVMQELRQEMPQYIDRPRPQTVRSVRVRKARNKRAPVAWVHLTPWADEFMVRLVEGGVELPKRRALVSPTAERSSVTDRYGNIKRGYLQKIKARPDKFFFGIPKGRAGQQNAGVWERMGRGGRAAIRQVVHFDPKPRRVQKQFPFYEIGSTHAGRRFPAHFMRAMQRAMRTAR